ncbi:MAG: hypothetical protein HQL64_08750 [Magnetococcales bacterium]|nr:hypothetical protein [Magnetococcales bacterium]
MSMPPPEAAKTLANHLAYRLASVDHVPHLLDAMRQLGMFGGRMELSAGQTQALPAFSPGNASTRIGLWDPVVKDGHLSHERIAADHFNASRWSNRERIPPKSGKKRIVYLGESVARGFFFDPHFNPVMAMESLLAGEHHGADHEIIDLACNGQFMSAMLKLAWDALALQPDMLIFFVGNNWLEPRALWQEAGPGMMAALRDHGGAHGMNQVIESWLDRRVVAFVEQLAKLAATQHIPVVMVLPEFNLLDFVTDNIAATPRFPTGGDVQTRWYRTWSDAQALRQQGRHAEAEALALELTHLDQGTTSTSFSLLARCQLDQGRSQAARHSLEQARDAMLWCWPLLTPRCPAVVRSAIRREIDKGLQGVSVIDLPECFDTWLDGELPGRRLFFDYCHLTVEGTAVAAAVMTATILERLDGHKADWRVLAAQAPKPAGTVISRAHLFAAMHNASWGQPAGLVRHHARKAAEQGDQVVLASTMAELGCRRLPGALCDIFPEVVQANDLFAIFRLADMGARRHDLLVDELTVAFQDLNPGLSSHIHQIRLQEYGLSDTGVDLLEPCHHIASWCQPETDWWKRSVHFKAYTVESRFLLVCADQPRDVELTLTCRLPMRSFGEAVVEVCIHHEIIQRIPLRAVWSTTRLVVSARLLAPGVNDIILRWPTDNLCQEETSHLADRADAEGAPVLFQPLGEIATFLARPLA